MPDAMMEEKPSISDFPENPEVKVRKRYRKKKTKLEEAFPTYLQVALTEVWKLNLNNLELNFDSNSYSLASTQSSASLNLHSY